MLTLPTSLTNQFKQCILTTRILKKESVSFHQLINGLNGYSGLLSMTNEHLLCCCDKTTLNEFRETGVLFSGHLFKLNELDALSITEAPVFANAAKVIK